MKRTIEYNGQELNIDIQKNNESITIVVNNQPYTFQQQITHNGWVLERDGQIFSTTLIQKQGDDYTINVNGSDVTIAYKDPYALSGAGGSGGAQGDVKAVMPGRVVKISVQEGQEVKANQPILVLEAMKMENEIKAPCDGIIEKIFVDESASVESGAMLISIQPLS